MKGHAFAPMALVVLVAALLLPVAASACPLCKDAKADTDYPGGTASLPKGFYYSILLMVSAPFLVVGGLAFRIYRSRRRTPSLSLPDFGHSACAESPSHTVAPPLPDSGGARP